MRRGHAVRDAHDAVPTILSVLLRDNLITHLLRVIICCASSEAARCDDDHNRRRRGICDWMREIGSAAAILICRAAAEEPVLEAQGAKKSEGRACAKVCGRLRPAKGLMFAFGSFSMVLLQRSTPTEMGRRPIHFGICNGSGTISGKLL